VVVADQKVVDQKVVDQKAVDQKAVDLIVAYSMVEVLNWEVVAVEREEAMRSTFLLSVPIIFWRRNGFFFY